EDLLRYQPFRYELKGFIDDIRNQANVSILHSKILGNYKQLQEIVERENIDKVVVALSDCRGKLPMETLLACKLQGVEVEEGATFYEQVCSKIMLENLRPSWLVFFPRFFYLPTLMLPQTPSGRPALRPGLNTRCSLDDGRGHADQNRLAGTSFLQTAAG